MTLPDTPAGPDPSPPRGDPLDAVAWPVRTERLVLRRATADDVDARWSFRSAPGVADWLSHAPVDRDSFVETVTDPDRMRKVLVVELLDEPGRVIGDLMISITDGWAQTEVAELAAGCEAELGWVLDPAYGGRGYATEAVLGAMSICFDRLGLHRVTAGCFAANEPSWRLMERVGMRRESATVRDALHRSGVWMDGYTYALLAEEWAERHGAP